MSIIWLEYNRHIIYIGGSIEIIGIFNEIKQIKKIKKIIDSVSR